MKIPYLTKRLDHLRSQKNGAINSYLSLMEKCLTGVIYEDLPLQALGQKEYDPQLREYGWDWPSNAHTMIGSKRLNNLRMLLERCLAFKVQGDFVETGVWRGGACIMAKAVFHAHGISDRNVWLADSFEGLPPPNPDLYPADQGDAFHTFKELVVDLPTVQNNFRKYGLLDENVKFLKGWFSETLPKAPIESIAVLRLDGDMYESTMDALEALFNKVSLGGYVIIDDYHVVKGCKAAVHDFINKRALKADIEEIDGVGIFWRKN